MFVHRIKEHSVTHLYASIELVATAFTEWERRYREHPTQFQSDFARFTNSAESYGDACAPYFASLLAELREG